jgi:hypothetical protein
MSFLALFSWITAIAGAVCALLAFLGASMGFLGKAWSDRLYKAGYLLMFASIGIFILRGLLA